MREIFHERLDEVIILWVLTVSKKLLDNRGEYFLSDENTLFDALLYESYIAMPSEGLWDE